MNTTKKFSNKFLEIKENILVLRGFRNRREHIFCIDAINWAIWKLQIQNDTRYLLQLQLDDTKKKTREYKLKENN